MRRNGALSCVEIRAQQYIEQIAALTTPKWSTLKWNSPPRDPQQTSWHQLTKPAEVRYGWAYNPILSVENQVELPLRPFRTDTKSER